MTKAMAWEVVSVASSKLARDRKEAIEPARVAPSHAHADTMAWCDVGAQDRCE